MIFKYKRNKSKRKGHTFQREPVRFYLMRSIRNAPQSSRIIKNCVLALRVKHWSLAECPALAVLVEFPVQTALIKYAVHFFTAHRLSCRYVFAVEICAVLVILDCFNKPASCLSESCFCSSNRFLIAFLSMFISSLVMYSVWALACCPFRDSILPERKQKSIAN